MKRGAIKIALCALLSVVVFAEIWLAWLMAGNTRWFGIWVWFLPITTCCLAFAAEQKFFPRMPEKESTK